MLLASEVIKMLAEHITENGDCFVKFRIGGTQTDIVGMEHDEDEDQLIFKC